MILVYQDLVKLIKVIVNSALLKIVIIVTIILVTVFHVILDIILISQKEFVFWKILHVMLTNTKSLMKIFNNSDVNFVVLDVLIVKTTLIVINVKMDFS